MPILGITWIVGMFSVNQKTVAFQYIFTLLNAFQVYNLHYYIFIRLLAFYFDLYIII